MELVGFGLRFFPLRHTVYCIECATSSSEAKGWNLKMGYGRKGAVPVIRTDSGFVRFVAVGGVRSQRKWWIQDKELDETQAEAITLTASRLGFRLIPSYPVPVAPTWDRCGQCKQPLLSAPGMPLG